MKKEKGIYARCSSCDNPIYEYMEENKKIFDESDLCGACCMGEAAVYMDELL